MQCDVVSDQLSELIKLKYILGPITHIKQIVSDPGLTNLRKDNKYSYEVNTYLSNP